MKKYMSSLCLGSLMALAGCSSAHIEDYAGKTPTLDIRQYFNGHVEAKGVFIDRGNKADTSFTASMKGTWHGNEGTLEEHFVYNDGRKQARIWTIHMTDEHHFTATAADVIGTAHGSQYGNAANMRYVLAVTTAAGKTYNLSMDDWVYRIDEHGAVNHVQMTKLGFKAGELVISFNKK